MKRSTTKGDVELVTEPFRREHAVLHEHLAHVQKHVGRIPYAGPAEQRKLMLEVLRFLRQHVLTHAHWEEQVLYPIVDRKAGNGGPFTATARHEHRIVARWLDELDQAAEPDEPDGRLFARKADQLIGLLLGHFEGEEEVLLPVLDRTMTPAEFERDVMTHAHAHPDTVV